jgi:hypothetical protein
MEALTLWEAIPFHEQNINHFVQLGNEFKIMGLMELSQ